MTTKNNLHLLSFDVRPQRLGYAVFVGRKRLLDWGNKSFRTGVNAVQVPLGRKVTQLINEWQPSMIVIYRPRSRRAAAHVKTIQALGRSRGIPVFVVAQGMVRTAFHIQRNKDERAAALAGMFPELALRLPPKRKMWQKEHYNHSIFDAVAAGITKEVMGSLEKEMR